MGKIIIGMMILSLLVDILLLAGTGELTASKPNKAGVAAAALLGAVYKALCMMPRLSGLNHLMIRFLILTIMGILAFGWVYASLRPVATFLVLEMALAGLVSGAGMGNMWSTILCGAALWLLCAFGYGQRSGQIIPAELTNCGHTVKIRALVDTGNLLTDPLTGESVLVVCNQLGAILAGLTEDQISDPVQTLLEMPNHGLRLLPYHTVGQKHGMMLAMKIDAVKLRGQKTGNLIAFAPHGLGMQKEYQALAGGI